MNSSFSSNHPGASSHPDPFQHHMLPRSGQLLSLWLWGGGGVVGASFTAVHCTEVGHCPLYVPNILLLNYSGLNNIKVAKSLQPTVYWEIPFFPIGKSIWHQFPGLPIFRIKGHHHLGHTSYGYWFWLLYCISLYLYFRIFYVLHLHYT